MQVSSYLSIYRPPTQNSKTLFNDEIEMHLCEANQLAKEILGKIKSKPAPRVKERSDSLLSYFSFISIDMSSRRSHSKSGFIFLGISAIITATTFLGKHFAHYLNISDRIKDNHTFGKDFKFKYVSFANHEHINKINHIVTNYSKILVHHRQNSAINCALCIAGLVGGVLLGIGAFYSALAFAGLTLVVAVTAAALFKLIFNNTRTSPDLNLANEIHSLWKQLKIKGKDVNIRRAPHPIILVPEDRPILVTKGFVIPAMP